MQGSSPGASLLTISADTFRLLTPPIQIVHSVTRLGGLEGFEPPITPDVEIESGRTAALAKGSELGTTETRVSQYVE
jgi:hypothetical protein